MKTTIPFACSMPGAMNMTDGSLDVCSGAVCVDGEVQPALADDQDYLFPMGCKLMYRHCCEFFDHFIVSVKHASDEASDLYWCNVPYDRRSIEPDELNIIGEYRLMPRPTATSIGELLIVPSDNRLLYLSWDRHEYRDTGNPFELPRMEFELLRKGNVSLSGSYEIPSAMGRHFVANQSAPASSIPHPATYEGLTNYKAASQTIHNALDHAIATQAESKGCFCKPFFVRYALRCVYGGYLAVSEPVLMPAFMLPPCLRISDVSTRDGVTSATFGAGLFPYYRLMGRFVSDLNPHLADYVTAIDIFVTEGIPTYDNKSQSTGVERYIEMIKDYNTGEPEPIRNNDYSDLYAGSWAEERDVCVDHYLRDLGLDNAFAWYLTPNPNLKQQLCSPGEFHLACSLAPDRARASQLSFELPIPSTSDASVKAAMPLAEIAAMQCIPEIVCGDGKRMVAIGGWQLDGSGRIHTRSAIRVSNVNNPFELKALEACFDGEPLAVRLIEGIDWQKFKKSLLDFYLFATDGVYLCSLKSDNSLSAEYVDPIGKAEPASIRKAYGGYAFRTPLGAKLLKHKSCQWISLSEQESKSSILKHPAWLMLKRIAEQQRKNTLLLTHPFCLEKDGRLRRLCDAAIRGKFRLGSVKIAAFASNDLRRWRLLDSSNTHLMQNIGGEPRRYCAFAAICDLKPEEHLSHIDLTLA